jgi:hypothetical protein
LGFFRGQSQQKESLVRYITSHNCHTQSQPFTYSMHQSNSNRSNKNHHFIVSFNSSYEPPSRCSATLVAVNPITLNRPLLFHCSSKDHKSYLASIKLHFAPARAKDIRNTLNNQKLQASKVSNRQPLRPPTSRT